MIKKRLIVGVCSFLFCIGYFLSPVYAAGITASFEEVTIQNLRVGQTYHTMELANLSLVITNTGKGIMNLKMDVLLPNKKDLKEGYEPIPYISWVKLVPDSSIIASGEKHEADIVISIPDKDEYLGKKYQFNIRAYSTNEVINVGTKSKFLFTTFSERGQTRKSLNLNFKVTPDEIHIKDVQLGSIIDVEKVSGKVLEIENLGETGSLYNFESIQVKDGLIKLDEGYEDCPDPSFLTFSAEQISVGMKESGKVKMFLLFPKERKYRNKKYMFLAQIKAFSGDVAKEFYCPIYVETK